MRRGIESGTPALLGTNMNKELLALVIALKKLCEEAELLILHEDRAADRRSAIVRIKDLLRNSEAMTVDAISAATGIKPSSIRATICTHRVEFARHATGRRKAKWGLVKPEPTPPNRGTVPTAPSQ